MTSKTPSRRLTDVLRSNSKETLLRNAAELARVSASLSPEGIQTRFMRNQHLISPKSLRLLYDATIFSRWCAFAVYKPPFCPMRRAEASSNYHHVSVESFVEAAVRSRDVYPSIQREIRPDEVKVRVVNDINVFSSGPVVVTVADRHSFTRTLKGFTMRYDVLVAGHLPLTEPRAVATERLFPPVCAAEGSAVLHDTTGQTTSDGCSSSALSSSCVCTYQVKRNAYYSVHPVSLVEFTIIAPPTPLPPTIELFVRTHLDTCVIGDPSGATADAEESRAAKSSLGVIAMRGDCDFPRVFTHLRELSINTDVADSAGDVVSQKAIEFHCRNCFEPILQRERIYSLKRRRVGLLDGAWTPEAEYM
ncbi:hypothetical protein, conserved [Trypanosoma brucei gambiense DAL972]|uniref:Uncharacterized protein n=1 Tax=Trypanosoma brucei gambiense (strain MHOM/CI/86/DAL972) TaxID=679716 RepID=C9ZPW2_TRYB9|nr:hypothetical protein, conserved [Trypanosoma brucei gambiense DAL972]CBH11440.1 hypothetical protein, conserved [Trypanosoma brucei gambiense DAL972]|eukprot:XP_011773727.1 hypothetical protein, conserved [Trypanosoma brucei gambiense DAL972]